MSEPDQVYAEAVLDCSESEISFLRYVCQDKCVFCQSNDCQRKVLRCLHVACNHCIVEHLSGKNTITCVRCHKDTPDPGPGRKLVDSLADWPELISTDSQSLGSGPESTPIHVCQHSDEDEEPAVSKCGECDLYLCDGHSTVHRVGKKTRSHTLTSLQRAHSGSQNCQLHPTNPLESVCKTCDMLCCAKCITTSGHKDHAVTSTAEYVKAVSHRLSDQMSKINRESALITEEEEIDSQMASVMDETKTMSATISRRFKSRRDALQKKEEEMKNELDKQCWSKLKILEGRKEMVKERRAKQLTSQHLLKSCSGVSLVQVSPAIICSVEEEKSIAGSESAAAIVLGGRFTSGCDDAEDASTICSLSFASTGAELERFDCASYSYCNLFDPQRKARGVTVSDQNHVATACSRSECGEAFDDTVCDLWHQISSVGNYNQGTVNFELECLENCEKTFFGVTFPNTKPSFPAFATLHSKLVAWTGCEKIMGDLAGGRLGQPWEKGDVVRLKMDCDAHQMTAVHVRSGDQDTIEIPSRYICLSVALYFNESIRLRIPSSVI